MLKLNSYISSIVNGYYITIVDGIINFYELGNLLNTESVANIYYTNNTGQSSYLYTFNGVFPSTCFVNKYNSACIICEFINNNREVHNEILDLDIRNYKLDHIENFTYANGWKFEDSNGEEYGIVDNIIWVKTIYGNCYSNDITKFTIKIDEKINGVFLNRDIYHHTDEIVYIYDTLSNEAEHDLIKYVKNNKKILNRDEIIKEILK